MTRLKTFQVDLEVLSPLFIGAGQDHVYSPYTDFVQVGDQLHLIDPDRLADALAEAPDLMEEYVTGVREKMDNNRSTFDLGAFIENRVGADVADLTARTIPVRGKLKRNKIQRHITSAGRPFIPGSTIKGAIRTALFYHWLREHPDGQRALQRATDRIDRLYDQQVARLNVVADMFERGGRNKRRAYEIVDEIREETLETLDVLNEEAVFGALHDEDDSAFTGPDMRHLRVSDTQCLDPRALEVMEVTRFKIEDASTISPQWSEVLPADTTLRFSIAIQPSFEEDHLAFLNEEGGFTALMHRIDKFATDCLGHELDILDQHQTVRELDAIFNFGIEVEDVPQKDNTALCRLGRGKTYFENSVGLAIQKESTVSFNNLRRLLGLGRNPITGAFGRGRFPATRSYQAIYDRQQNKVVPHRPLGWVKLSLR